MWKIPSVDTAFADNCLQDEAVVLFGKEQMFAEEDSNLFGPATDHGSVDASAGASSTSGPPSGPPGPFASLAPLSPSGPTIVSGPFAMFAPLAAGGAIAPLPLTGSVSSDTAAVVTRFLPPVTTASVSSSTAPTVAVADCCRVLCDPQEEPFGGP